MAQGRGLADGNAHAAGKTFVVSAARAGVSHVRD
jgi:hypothetical protein